MYGTVYKLDADEVGQNDDQQEWYHVRNEVEDGSYDGYDVSASELQTMLTSRRTELFLDPEHPQPFGARAEFGKTRRA